jgi:nicotinamidase-related amidase
MDPEAHLAEYRAKGLAQPVGLGERPALVVVDMTEGFTDPASPLGTDLTPVVGEIARLLDAFRARSLPVIFTTVTYFDSQFRDGGWFVVKVPSLKLLTPGSRWVQVDARLAPLQSETVLVKQYASAFFRTALDALLRAAHVDTVVVTGATTSGCVRATAVDALQYGYRVIVPFEAVGDRNAAAHAANLIDIAGKYGDVLPVQSVLEAVASSDMDMLLPPDTIT